MRSIGNLSKKMSMAVLAMLLTSSLAIANTLNEVEIKTNESGYGIVLRADEAVQIKRTVSTNDKMSIELKDVKVSEDFNTVYNNVADIDNITVAQTEKGGIKITFKGKNVADSKVYFDTTKVATIKQTEPVHSIELSAPISSFTPVYKPEMFDVEENVVESQTSNPQLNEVLTKMHITKSMLVTAKAYAKKIVNKTKSGDINMLTMMGIVFVIAAFALRPSKKQSVKLPEKAGLSGMLAQQPRTPQMEREIALNQSLASSMNLKSNNLSGSTVNTGYGMKAYQQSQRNPYTSPVQTSNGVSGIARRKPLQATPIKKPVTTNKPVSAKVNVPIRAKAPSMINPAPKKTIQNISSQEAEMDSMKFLESITKIYEKNGRADLAKGLQDNLKKAQMSQKLAV